MGAKDEGGVHAAFVAQRVGELGAQTYCLCEDIAHHAVERMGRVPRPQPEIAHTSAAEITLLLKAPQREVYRPLRAADASHQVARVKLLAGRSGQKGEQLNLGRALTKPGGTS